MSQTATNDWEQLKQKLLQDAPASVRPLFVGMHPETDACALWCQHMGDKFAEEPPNVALVHVAKTRDAAALVKQLPQREAETGAPALPVMVLSPTGDVPLDDVNRRVYQHSMPVRLERLIASLNKLIERGSEPGPP